MKIYSISLIALAVALLWVSPNLPDPGNNVNPTKRVGSMTNTVSPKGFVSGTWPASSGFHSYGFVAIDATGIPVGGNINISYQAHDVPNRFTIFDDCGLGRSVQSVGSSTSNGWVGSASYPGPWGSSLPGINATGTVTMKKISGCNFYKFEVTTSTSSTITDYYQVNY